LIRRVRIRLMRIDLIEGFGPAPAIITVQMPEYGDGFPRPVKTVPDHPLISGGALGLAHVSALESFFSSNTFPSSPAIKNDKPVIPMQSRRRRGALLLRGRCGDKRLHLAADPAVPELNSRPGCRPPVGGSDQTKSLHHQARDTLRGDEGA
jgi:hypothetical protein